jgi:caffeoyl-CoA O-methyltransferase
MTNRNNMGLSDELHAYVLAHAARPTRSPRDLVAETRSVLPAQAECRSRATKAGLLTLLTKLVGARLRSEVGTFTGMSALAIARGLPRTAG